MLSDAYILINQFLAVMGVMFFCIGLSLLFLPVMTLRMIRLVNVWIDTDRWLGHLDSEFRSEAFIYRHHRLFGGFILLASVWIFWIFVVRHSARELQLESILDLEPAINEWMADSVIFLIRLISVLFMVLGIIIFLRPSLLKRLELRMNRWVSTDIDRSLQAPHREADEYLVRHPRLIGGFIACAGLYLTLSSAVLLFS